MLYSLDGKLKKENPRHEQAHTERVLTETRRENTRKPEDNNARDQISSDRPA